MTKDDLFEHLMSKAGLSQKTYEVFKYYYQLLLNGEKGILGKQEIYPPDVDDVIRYDLLTDTTLHSLQKLAIIKLNGGLGTSMGLSQAKSLLPVKNKDTFLDIIAQQVLKTREKLQIKLPLIFMNSFNTSEDTLIYLKKYPTLQTPNIPLDFIQNKFPKIRMDNFAPLQHQDDHLNWNPPGHGDLYSALFTTRLLEILLDHGIDYIFVSNADNLGATIDPLILNYMISEQIDFVMEVCYRTENDKKGGHLAKHHNGKMVLREIAQCPDDELEEFQNISLYQYFNTNNLWVNLLALKNKLSEYQGFLPLPLILNKKKVGDTPIYQLETAMGAAISTFNRSKAVIVPRTRFLPVKKNQDLLLLWSDSYELSDDYMLRKVPEAKDTILDLDDRYYGTIDQLQKACANRVPSLKECESLTIRGFVKF